MKLHIFCLLLVFVVLAGGGCDPVEQQRLEAYSDIEGITLKDLQAERASAVDSESLFSFTVLRYVLDADSIGELETVIDSLSQGDIDYNNVEAFEANGFAVGLGLQEEGASIAQKLQSIGAFRIAQGTFMIPPNSNEILYSESFIGPQSVIYSTSKTGFGGATLGTGHIGWILSVRQLTAAGDVIQVNLCPAYWQVAGSELRLLTGQEPYQYHFFDTVLIRFEMEASQFCVLGPERVVTNQDTLDRLLMGVPRRNQVRFFVILFTGQRGINGN